MYTSFLRNYLPLVGVTSRERESMCVCVRVCETTVHFSVGGTDWESLKCSCCLSSLLMDPILFSFSFWLLSVFVLVCTLTGKLGFLGLRFLPTRLNTCLYLFFLAVVEVVDNFELTIHQLLFLLPLLFLFHSGAISIVEKMEHDTNPPSSNVVIV